MLDLKSSGSVFKSSTLQFTGFVLAHPEFLLGCAAILKHFMFIYVIVKCYWTAIERALITYNIIIITPIVQRTNINTNFFTNFGFNSCDGLRRKARDAS